jgi:serine/threonine-protein kinase
VLEPPSTSLLKTLSALRLCSPRDLRRCRGYVRRLTYDLPAFDSIWIDALVQSQRLTAFQGHCLEAGHGERLQVGPCLLLERLGGTATAETFLARRRDAEDVCVLKLTTAAPEQLRPQGERLAKLVSVAASFRHPAIVLPQATQIVEWPASGEWRQVTISPHVRGPHLAELLVRRGRFPDSVVVEIGRQLLDGLVALESQGLVHGDISLSNVRITPQGQAVLVDAGLVPELRPQFTFHTVRSADRYDGLAPERISVGLPPSSISDLYALGCLLWHLLAGRPPFAAGDALAKIAAHQTQPIGDVREWVPDAPDWLAETLLCWTAINPAARPRTLREAAADFGRPTRAGRRRLAVFRGEFDRSTPRRPTEESSSRWPLTVAVIFVLTGASLSLFDQGARNFVLSLARPKATASPDVTPHEARREPLISEPQPLPAPDGSGRMLLAPGGRYLAEEIAGAGSLQIIGDAIVPAEIIVTEQALSLWAEHVQLQHVRLVRQTSAIDRPPPLLIADCQQLVVADSRFEQRDADGTRARRPGAAIAWRSRESVRSRETSVTLRNVAVVGDGPAVYLQSPPQTLAAENVLKVGGGDFLQLSDSRHSDWQCDLHRVTLRDSGPLLRCWPASANAPFSRMTLSATGCVVDLARAANAPASEASRPCLIAWMTGRLPSNWASAIDWHLTGLLVSPDIDILARVDPTTGQRTAVDESQLDIAGLVVNSLEFNGPASPRPQDSVLSSFDASLPAATPVGIDADALPSSSPSN